MESTPFTINSNQFGFIMGLLDQYSDPPSAVLREYVSNAVDAVNGITDGKVTVILPSSNADSSELVIKDNGCGMSEDFVINHLNSYADSSKRDDTASIGSKGIGSKSAFSITDKFTITTVKDGVKTVAVNDKKNGQLLHESTPTDEPDGTIVSIPVDYNMACRIISRADAALRGFDSNVVIVCNNDGTVYNGIDWFDRRDNAIKLTDGISFMPEDDVYVIQAGVSYSLRSLNYDIMYGLKYAEHDADWEWKNNVNKYIFRFSSRIPNGVVFNLPANALELNPSRESIINNCNNRNIIISLIKELHDKVHANAINADKGQFEVDSHSWYHNDYCNAFESLIDSELADKKYAGMSWHDACSLCNSLSSAFVMYDISIGGHEFHEKCRFADDGMTSLFKRRSTYAERSPYDSLAGTAKNGFISTTIRNGKTNMLVIKNITDYNTEVTSRIIRNRRTYFEETKRDETKYDYIMLSATDPVSRLDYWDSKRAGVFDVVDYNDYIAVMDARKKRMKKERSKNGVKASTKRTVTCLAIRYGSTERFVTSINDAIAYKDHGYVLLRLDNDEFYDMYCHQFKMNILLHKVSLSQTGLLTGGKFLIIKNKGSKSLMKDITDNTVAIDDIDYNDNMNALMASLEQSALDVEKKRCQYNLVRNYRIRDYDNNARIRTVFTCINEHSDAIKSVDTRNMIQLLDNVTIDFTGRIYHEIKNKSIDITTDINKLIDLGAEMNHPMNVEDAVSDINDAVNEYTLRYPMLSYVFNPSSHGVSNSVTTADVENAIMYINQMDELAGRI